MSRRQPKGTSIPEGMLLMQILNQELNPLLCKQLLEI
jgi:hypothetical protein